MKITHTMGKQGQELTYEAKVHIQKSRQALLHTFDKATGNLIKNAERVIEIDDIPNVTVISDDGGFNPEMLAIYLAYDARVKAMHAGLE